MDLAEALTITFEVFWFELCVRILFLYDIADNGWNLAEMIVFLRSYMVYQAGLHISTDFAYRHLYFFYFIAFRLRT